MAARYDRGRRLRAEDIDAWMAAARPYLPGPGGRVLDLGAGTGRFSVALAEATGAAVIACEPAAAMRVVCRANCPGIAVVGARAEAPPFHERVFDTVWASQVIHHIVDVAAFAAGVRHMLKPDGFLLLRGGFGPPEELPLYRYFPEAWRAGMTVARSLSEISDILAAAGVRLRARVKVGQVLAESPAELIERVRTRSLSNLAGLADDVFERGLASMRQHAQEDGIPQRIVEHLDLVVFQPEPEGASAD